ncbi:hypothetical protein [Limosilactobacillus pontis]|uniref:hypothetical protein n=1 Tax=Limosilactobacillus pontis TaxID=35787 RepID=UPI002F25F449
MGLFSNNEGKFDKVIAENDTLENYKKSLAYLAKTTGVTNGDEAIIAQGFLVLHHDLQEIKKAIEDKK